MNTEYGDRLPMATDRAKPLLAKLCVAVFLSIQATPPPSCGRVPHAGAVLSEWNLPHGVGGGAGPPVQAGAPHRQGPRPGVRTVRQPTGPHQAEGTQRLTVKGILTQMRYYIQNCFQLS